MRQSGLLGLNVTRKVFVPLDGYFARYLEELNNPTSVPITVDLSVASNLRGWFSQFGFFQTYYLARTSSGDVTLDVPVDRWVTFDSSGGDPYYRSNVGSPVALVLDGLGARDHLDAATWNPNAVPNFYGTFSHRWNAVTIPAGGTTTLMHFVVQQASQTSAIASAERLSSLPPEALGGLSPAEVLSIVNFAVPASGTSLVPALPEATGVVTGRALEGDMATPVPGAAVSFRSANAFFPREWTTTTAADGSFSFAGAPGRPVPLDGYAVQARHPLNTTYLSSPVVEGLLAAGTSTLQANIVFNSGILHGVVRRTNGIPVGAGSVALGPYATLAIGAGGAYEFRGVPASTNIAVGGSVPRADQSNLRIAPQVISLAVGETRTLDLLVEPIGRLTGLLTDGANVPQPGRTLELRSAAGSRYVQTDSSGRFAFEEVSVGTFTLVGTDPASFFVSQQAVVVVQDQTTDVVFRFVTSGTLTVNATRSSGSPIGGMRVRVFGSGFSRPDVVTDANGTAVVTNIPLGQAATVVVDHPSNGSISASSVVTMAAGGGGLASVNLSLPAFGTVQGTVRTTVANAVGGGVRVETSGPSVYFSTTTSAAGAYTVAPMLAGRPFTVTTYHPTVLVNYFGSNYSPFTRTPVQSLTTDGQVLTVDTFLPAVARLRVTVREADGTPIPNAAIETRDTRFDSWSARGATNASGVVEVAQVQEGAVGVRVYRPGQASPAELAEGEIRRQDDNGTVDLTVTVRAFTVTIRGRVTEADGVSPLASPFPVELFRGVDLQFLRRTCASGQFCFSDNSQRQPGEFVFENVPVSAAGVVIRTYAPIGGSTVGTYSLAVLPTSNGEVNVTVVQPFRRATLGGRVLASDGTTPVGTGTVFPVTFSGYSTFGTTVDAQGHWDMGAPLLLPIEGLYAEYQLGGLPDGRIRVATGPVTVRDQVVDVPIVLPASVFSVIQGRIVAGDGVTPFDYASVSLSFASGTCQPGYRCSASTNAAGDFELQLALPADGGFTLRASASIAASPVVTRSLTAPGQGAVFDAGTFVIPVSVLSGRVSFGATAAAPDVQVIVRSGSTDVAFVTTDQNGDYRMFGLPPGTYTVLAQHYQSGLTGSTPVEILSTESAARADIQLPPVGTVHVRVFGPDGTQQPATRVSLTLPGDSFQQFCSESESVSPEANGDCVFQFASPGGYYAQAALEQCDANGICQAPIFASASATLLGASQTLTIDIRFDRLGQVAVTTDPAWLQTGRANDGDLVRLTLRAMGASGVLGAFVRELQTTASTAIHRSLFDEVPPGRIVVTAERFNTDNTNWEALARVEGELRADHGAVPAAIDLTSSTGAEGFWYALVGTDDWYYFVDRSGLMPYGGRRIGADLGYTGAFQYLNRLQVNNVQTGDARVLSSAVVPGGVEVTVGPFVTGGATHTTRRMFVPQGGGFMRYLDQISNDTDVPVIVNANLASASQYLLPATASTPSVTEGGVLAFGDGFGARASYASVFAGIHPPTTVTLGFADGSFSASTVSSRVTVAPHSKMTLLHFVVLRDPADTQGVASQAAALVALTDPNALIGLSAEDLATVVNYRFTEVRGRAVAGDGVTPVAGALLDLTTVGGSCSPCMTTANANGEFMFAVVLPPTGVFSLAIRAPVLGAQAVTRSFTAVAQAALFNTGQIDVPGSVVSGLVTFGASAPAANVTVTVISDGTNVAFLGTDQTGAYTVVGLIPGTYTFTAQHAQSGFTNSVTVVVESTTTPVRADIQLPPRSVVVVGVIDVNGNHLVANRVALTAPDGTFSAVCGAGDSVVPDMNGDCRFEFTPDGGFYAQAMIRQCDTLACGPQQFASTSGVLSDSGATMAIEIQFGLAPQVIVQTDPDWVVSGRITQGDPVRVTLRAMGANGALGLYERAPMLAAASQPTALAFNDVPPGRVVVTTDRQMADGSWEAIARVESVVPADPNADPVVLDLAIGGNADGFGHGLSGDDMWWHYLGLGGELVGAGRVINNTLVFDNAFQQLNVLSTNGVVAADGRALTVEGSAFGQEVTIGPFATTGPAYVTRRVFSPQAGGFIRYVDVYSNDTDVPVNVNATTSGLANTTTRFDESLASQSAGGTLGYDPSAEGRAVFELVFGGADANQTPVLTYEGGQFDRPIVATTFTVQPHSKSALLHFVIMREPGDTGGVSAQASTLALLTEPNGLVGLTPEDLAMIVNFRVPQ